MTDAAEKIKRPAFQFYPKDWREDVELQSCSMAAQGLWINMMCVAHQCTPYGHLTVNGKAMNAAQLGRQVGLSAREAEGLLQELEDAGVARRTPEGVLFSKRMVDDEALRMARAAGGHAGAEHGAKGAKAGSKGGRPKADKGGSKTPLGGDEKPPPSSSSSSSSSDLFEGADAPSSDEPQTPPSFLPPCPTQKLLALFGEKVPELPQPRRELWDDSQGADAMRQRWKWLLSSFRENGARYATDTDEGLVWFAQFFETVGESDHLMGKTGAWRADLSWLMKRDNFRKVIEGNYENKQHRRAA